MSTVTPLFHRPRTPIDADCIEALEGLLKRAKTGDIVAIVSAYRRADGRSGYTAGGIVGGHVLQSVEKMMARELPAPAAP